MQKYDHWIHMLGTLREEWLVSQFFRIVYFRTEFQLKRQKLMAKQKAITNGSAFNDEEDNESIKYVVPRKMQNSSTYWNEVENNGFLLSAKYGAPTFFLTFTTNLDWDEFKDIREFDSYHNGSAISRVFKIRFHRVLKYLQASYLFGTNHAIIWRIEYQQRGLPHAHVLIWSNIDTSDISCLEALINTRYLKDDHNLSKLHIIHETNDMIKHLQTHVCSPRCRKKQQLNVLLASQCQFPIKQKL